MVVALTSCGSGNDKSTPKSIFEEELSDTSGSSEDSGYTQEMQNSETVSTEQSQLGTYVYIQPDNHDDDKKLVITLNEDETAVAKATDKKGEEKTFYGSWSEDFSCNGYRLTFSDSYFTWDGRTTCLLEAWMGWAECFSVDGAIIRDGYLYADWKMAKAKHPEYRVKLEKTN